MNSTFKNIFATAALGILFFASHAAASTPQPPAVPRTTLARPQKRAGWDQRPARDRVRTLGLHQNTAAGAERLPALENRMAVVWRPRSLAL